jgi:hypothetical protein
MLSVEHRVQQRPRGGDRRTGAKQMISLDEHEIGDDEVAAEGGDERRGELVRLVTAVRRGDERPRVGDRPQRASIGARRYSSARRPRSVGPSPVAT